MQLNVYFNNAVPEVLSMDGELMEISTTHRLTASHEVFGFVSRHPGLITGRRNSYIAVMALFLPSKRRDSPACRNYATSSDYKPGAVANGELFAFRAVSIRIPDTQHHLLHLKLYHTRYPQSLSARSSTRHVSRELAMALFLPES